jgi:hypothetical protein
MPLENLNTISFLDKIRLNDGNNRLMEYYNGLIKANVGKAINLINDENLYVFMPLLIILLQITGISYYA